MVDGRWGSGIGESGTHQSSAINHQPSTINHQLSLVELEAAGDPEFVPAEAPGLEDECLLVYTSGTTGPPKGVVLTQYNLLVDARGIAEWQGIDGEHRLMCVLPIH